MIKTGRRLTTYVLLLSSVLIPASASVAGATAAHKSSRPHGSTQATSPRVGRYSVPKQWQCDYDAAKSLTNITSTQSPKIGMAPYWHMPAHGGANYEYVGTYVVHQVLVGGVWRKRYEIEYIKLVKYGRFVNATGGAPSKTSRVHTYQGVEADRVEVKIVWFEPRHDAKNVAGGQILIVGDRYIAASPSFGTESSCPSVGPDDVSPAACPFSAHTSRPRLDSSAPREAYSVWSFQPCAAPPGYYASVDVTVDNSIAEPYANDVIRVVIDGRNHAHLAATSDEYGTAHFSYLVRRAGRDNLRGYVDQNDNGVLDPDEPSTDAALVNPTS